MSSLNCYYGVFQCFYFIIFTVQSARVKYLLFIAFRGQRSRFDHIPSFLCSHSILSVQIIIISAFLCVFLLVSVIFF